MMHQSIEDKSIWLKVLSFWKFKEISILVVSISLIGCASLKPLNKELKPIPQSTERKGGAERSDASSILPSSNFYLSISKPSEYELFLRPDLLEQENLTGQEELTQIWESGLTEEIITFLETSLQLDTLQVVSTESESEHLHGLEPYHSAFHVLEGRNGKEVFSASFSDGASRLFSSVAKLDVIEGFNWFNRKHDSYPKVFPPFIHVHPTPDDMELPKEPVLLFAPPLDNAYILRGVNPKCWNGRGGHCGVDMVSAKGKGDVVRAVEDGIVLDVGTRKRYGHYAIIFHRGGILSLYSHALEDPDLEPCQPVKKQEVIAKVGKSGNARSPHLHFEMIDLDKGWQGKTDLDTLIEQMCRGKGKKDKSFIASVQSKLENLVFRKDLKLDPLDYIPNLANNRAKFQVGTRRVQAKANSK